MSTATLPIAMPRPVTRKVALLRWCVRLYVAVEGLAAIVVVLGSAFWIGLAIDWIFEPTPAVRVAMWLVVAVATLYVAAKLVFMRALRRLPNSSLALLLERNHPQLGESVVTTVDAADRSRSLPVGHSVMLRHTGAEAARALAKVRLSSNFRFRPLAWKSAAAALLLLSIALFSLGDSDTFAFWTERMQLSNAPWPRQVDLAVVGFEQQENGKRIVNVARDDDYQLQVHASIREGHTAPAQVEIRYRLADGRRGRDIMTKVGEALPGRDDFQLYQYTFKSVTADLDFDLLGGDDRLGDLQLRVVQRPQIVRMVLDCEFPDYTQRPPQTIPVSGRVDLPEGTRALCRVATTKALTEIRIHDPDGPADLPATIDHSNPRQFTFHVDLAAADRTLLITMRDVDEVENREPYRVILSTQADQLPDISVQLRGIGSAITTNATVPLEGRITDEYGIVQTWFEYQIDQHAPQQRPLPKSPDGRREVTEIGRLDLSDTDPTTKQPLVQLKPGQQLSLAVKAQDAYDLTGEPHVGSSQRFIMDVVTASQLRALLEKRELGLRQRFEAIYEKMLATGELLTRIEIGSGKQDPAEPGAEQEGDADQTERLFRRDQLRIGGALQNATQLAYETIGVAEGFDDIVAQLVNNRVDTEELKQRLQRGIADPLREVGDTELPELEKRLQTLESDFVARTEAAASLRSAQAQTEVVLEAMKKILDRMLELESYNELVELLRGIVGEQEQLMDQTKQRRREKLRALLEDQ